VVYWQVGISAGNRFYKFFVAGKFFTGGKISGTATGIGSPRKITGTATACGKRYCGKI
jgi:hypothetical protein